MKQTLWTRDFTLLTVATVLGAAGGVASSFALSFLVLSLIHISEPTRRS